MTNHYPMIIDNKRIDTDKYREIRSPYDNRTLGTVPVATSKEIDLAVSVASSALISKTFPTHERATILDRLASALVKHHENFAQSISDEAAKPIATARVEAARAVETVQFSAAVARTLSGDLINMEASSVGEGKTGFVKRVPIGVVGAITPFNFPLNLVCHKVAPAIAAGCPIILKPASSTPLTALLLGEILTTECGLPPGWFNIVTCSGETAGRLVEHDDVAMITFTGSPEVGWGIRAQAPKKKISLELGNNSPVIIEPDIEIASVAAKICLAAFSYSGQTCISTQRLYVHDEIAEKFIDALIAKTLSLVVGDPANLETNLSSLIDNGETERVMSWINEATGTGAKLVCGGTVTDGIINPTILTKVTDNMKVSCNEVFGPVVGIATYSDYEEALKRSNESNYGLQAAVFTNDLNKAMKAAETLNYGGIMINEVPTWRADHMPYGGVRNSGNTREGPAYAIKEMTEERLIVIQS